MPFKEKFEYGDKVLITKGQYKQNQGVIKDYRSAEHYYDYGEYTVDILVDGDVEKVKIRTAYLEKI